MKASVLSTVAALLCTANSLSTVQGTASLLELDAPYLSDNSLYFPQNAGAWENPNSTASARVSEQENPFSMAECYGVDLEEATIDQMQGWMGSGKLTSRQLVQCYLGHILQLNEYVK